MVEVIMVGHGGQRQASTTLREVVMDVFGRQETTGGSQMDQERNIPSIIDTGIEFSRTFKTIQANA
jgi:hypothetical protein